MFQDFFIYVALLMELAIISLVIIFYKEFKAYTKQQSEIPQINHEGNRMKLQALERLTMFAERCGLANLIDRINQPGMSASDLHFALTESIKTEFEYNISQQVYVSPEVWNAITRLKDQNIYIIHHITASLSPAATALDLSKLIIEYSNTPNAEMNGIVLSALQTEAKQILN